MRRKDGGQSMVSEGEMLVRQWHQDHLIRFTTIFHNNTSTRPESHVTHLASLLLTILYDHTQAHYHQVPGVLLTDT